MTYTLLSLTTTVVVPEPSPLRLSSSNWLHSCLAALIVDIVASSVGRLPLNSFLLPLVVASKRYCEPPGPGRSARDRDADWKTDLSSLRRGGSEQATIPRPTSSSEVRTMRPVCPGVGVRFKFSSYVMRQTVEGAYTSNPMGILTSPNICKTPCEQGLQCWP